MTFEPPSPFSAMPGVVQHIATSLDVGGAQEMLAKLIEAGAAKRQAGVPAVLSLTKPRTLTSRIKNVGCPVYTLGLKRGQFGPLALLRLIRITSVIDPDVVQGWMYHGNIAASFAAIGQGRVPVLWNVRHSLADPTVESRMNRWLLGISARMSKGVDAIIYNSRQAAREHAAIGYEPSRAVHIPNGFDCQLYRPDPDARGRLIALMGHEPDDPVVGMVARQHPMKDHAMLARAVVRARAAGSKLHLLMVGTDMTRPNAGLAEVLRELQRENAVTLVDERRDIADWLPGLDMLALSSAWGEAFPNVLGEAMACGVPCIATDVGDSGWVMGSGGMLVPPRDDEAMAAALAGMLDIGEAGRRAMGEAGRNRVIAEFELNEIAVQYRRLYSAALARKAHGVPIDDARSIASDAGVRAA